MSQASAGSRSRRALAEMRLCASAEPAYWFRLIETLPTPWLRSQRAHSPARVTTADELASIASSTKVMCAGGTPTESR